MTEMEAIIKNRNGIHCRPSAVIFKAVEEYPGEIIILGKEEDVPLTSILNLLSLGLKCGTRTNIRVSGPDEEKVCAKLVTLFELEFDFPPKDQEVVFNPTELAAKYKIYSRGESASPD